MRLLGDSYNFMDVPFSLDPLILIGVSSFPSSRADTIRNKNSLAAWNLHVETLVALQAIDRRFAVTLVALGARHADQMGAVRVSFWKFGRRRFFRQFFDGSVTSQATVVADFATCNGDFLFVAPRAGNAVFSMECVQILGVRPGPEHVGQ